MTGSRPAIRIVPRRVVFALAAAAALLVAAHLGLLAIKASTGRDYVFGLVPLFDLDVENNVPSFFSGGLLLLNAIFLWLVDRLPARRSRSTVWRGLALIFVFLAYDELFGIHERLTQPLREALQTSGLLHYAWVIAYAAPLVALIAWFVPTWRTLDAATQRRLAIAGGLYFLGAIVMEMIGGAWDDAFGRRTVGWGMLVAVEESLEMAGLLVLVHGLMMLLRPSAGGATVVIDDQPPAAVNAM